LTSETLDLVDKEMDFYPRDTVLISTDLYESLVTAGKASNEITLVLQLYVTGRYL